MLTITNSLTQKKETFTPENPPQVRMYVCGITPYDAPHIGHGRVYVTFDVVYRLLSFLGYQVAYCRNFTDIDDKLLKKAQALYGDAMRYPEIATNVIAQYHRNMQALGCLPPTFEPRVTDNIPLIISFIEQLIARKKAYVVDGDVYFSIESFPQYGQLAKHDLDDLIAGARVEIDTRKKHPLDFALWKSEKENSFWKSPWGYGRPGWHIECSALAAHFLCTHIDIHGGGADLQFPHHENEIAQSEALYGPPFAKYWMHNGLVTVNHEKMSKSLGNFFTLDDIFAKINPMDVRFYFLSHHYRPPLEFSFDGLESHAKAYAKLCRAFEAIPAVKSLDVTQAQSYPIVQRMLTYLSDDFNTPGMFGVIFENLSEIAIDQAQAGAIKYLLQQVLGLPLQIITKEVKITPEIQVLLDEREKARAAKDWARADKLRDELGALGYQVQDKKKN